MDEFRAYQQTDKVDKLKTLAEHEQIILNYWSAGRLDRNHAISVYCEFFDKNPGYRALVQVQASISQNGANITTLSDDDIVRNLNQQVVYLSGRSILEELRNGQ